MTSGLHTRFCHALVRWELESRWVRGRKAPHERAYFGTVLYTVSHKNDTDVAHYNFNAYQPILVIFGRDAAK